MGCYTYAPRFYWPRYHRHVPVDIAAFGIPHTHGYDQYRQVYMRQPFPYYASSQVGPAIYNVWGGYFGGY